MRFIILYCTAVFLTGCATNETFVSTKTTSGHSGYCMAAVFVHGQEQASLFLGAEFKHNAIYCRYGSKYGFEKKLELSNHIVLSGPKWNKATGECKSKNPLDCSFEY